MNIIITYLIFCSALLLSITFVLGAIKWYNNKRWPEVFQTEINLKPYSVVLIIAVLLWGILYIL